MTYNPLNPNGQATMANSQPMVLASDQTSIPVAATLTAETTKVIGVVRNGDGSGNLLTSNSTTYTAKFGLDTNLLGTLGTAFSTAGKVDIKGADGDIFIRQATASNLNATVIGTGTFVTQSTLAAETTKVIGTTRTLGNIGAILDGVNTAATAPANGMLTLGIYNSTEPSPTTGQSVGIQLDSKGRTRQVIMDAAGNTRGANVDASNRLSVSVDAFSATNASVNLAQVGGSSTQTGSGTATGAQRVEIANNGTGTLATITTVSTVSAFGNSTTGPMKAEDVASAGGDQGVAIMVRRKDALVANAQVSNDEDYLTPITNNFGAVYVQDTPNTTGGLSKFHLVSASGTNVTNIAAQAGQVYAITAFNINAAARYLKFHNTASTPTAGSGVTDTYMIPGNTAGAGLVINVDKGIAFSTGIGISLVTGIADADTTGVAASEIIINIYYK